VSPTVNVTAEAAAVQLTTTSSAIRAERDAAMAVEDALQLARGRSSFVHEATSKTKQLAELWRRLCPVTGFAVVAVDGQGRLQGCPFYSATPHASHGILS